MTKEKLIQILINDGYLKTPGIIDAFKKIDRGDFLPESEKERAYENIALPIGYEQTISQPLTIAFMFELLEPKSGEKILDIGSGSGWTVALLSEIVGNSGKVFGIERIPELAKFSKNNISKLNIKESNAAEIVEGDGSEGYEKEAPYDKIISAAAAKEIPSAWKNQLKIGGLIVSPINHSIVRLEKKSANEFEKKEYFGFNFVPLIIG